jgi:hypothetical protein
VFYLKYDMYRNSWPLLALATYRNLLNQSVARRNGSATHGISTAEREFGATRREPAAAERK